MDVYEAQFSCIRARLELFINVVSAYMEHNVEALGFINCPCRDRKNLNQWDSMELSRGHLL